MKKVVSLLLALVMVLAMAVPAFAADSIVIEDDVSPKYGNVAKDFLYKIDAEKIINKAPSDGLGLKTDEEKMGIKYSEIAEMIETGTTENEMSKNEIIRRFKAAKHKRSLVPVFKIDRKNYLLDL